MFKELEQLLATKTLSIIMTNKDGIISLTVIPKAKDKTTETDLPLTITGTAEELDQTLGASLKEYTVNIVGATSNLAMVKAELEEAKRKARADERKNAKTKTKSISTPPAQDDENSEDEEDNDEPDLFSQDKTA